MVAKGALVEDGTGNLGDNYYNFEEVSIYALLILLRISIDSS